MTSKGQITIPKQVRERLQLKPGDQVAFYEREGGIMVVEAAKVHLMDLAGSLKTKIKGVTLEQMNDAIARAAVERFGRASRKASRK